MPMRIRRFKVIQTANTVAVVYAVLLGVAFLLFGLIFVAVFSSFRSVGGLGTGFFGAAGLVGLVFAWAIYVVVGWVLAALFCLIYNGAARITGGIEFEMTQAPPPGWGQAGPTWGAPPPGAWPQPQQPGPSWGATPPPQGAAWGPPPGTSWGPNPPAPRPGPSWPTPPPASGGQAWSPPRDAR